MRGESHVGCAAGVGAVAETDELCLRKTSAEFDYAFDVLVLQLGAKDDHHIPFRTKCRRQVCQLKTNRAEGGIGGRLRSGCQQADGFSFTSIRHPDEWFRLPAKFDHS